MAEKGQEEEVPPKAIEKHPSFSQAKFALVVSEEDDENALLSATEALNTQANQANRGSLQVNQTEQLGDESARKRVVGFHDDSAPKTTLLRTPREQTPDEYFHSFSKKVVQNENNENDNSQNNLSISQDHWFAAIAKFVKFPMPSYDKILALGELGNGNISLSQFQNGLSYLNFLTRVYGASTDDIESIPSSFMIPATFDQSKTTLENYSSANTRYYGDYAKVRKILDYDYYPNSCRPRQTWQDHALASIAKPVTSASAKSVFASPGASPIAPANPWVLFTFGPVGSGKIFTVSWMAQKQYLTFENIIRISPRDFRMMAPEWKKYESDGNQGEKMCQKESMYISELSLLISLQKKVNIWFDGEYCDFERYPAILDLIRKDFPEYSTALMFVTAKPEILEKRVKESGVSSAKEEVNESFDACYTLLGQICHKADVVLHINTNDSVPKLDSFAKINRKFDPTKIHEFFNFKTNP